MTLIYSDLGQLAALNPSHRSRRVMVQISAQYKGKKRIMPDLVRLSGAKTVRAQLDGVDLDLTDAQLKRLQAFAKELPEQATAKTPA